MVKTRDRVIIGDLLLQTVTEHRSGSGPSRLKTLVGDALEAELTAFVMAVRGDAPNPIPAIEGLRSLTAALTCSGAARMRDSSCR